MANLLNFRNTVLNALCQVYDRPGEMVRHKVDNDVADDDVAKGGEDVVGEPKVEHSLEQVILHGVNLTPNVSVAQKYYIILLIRHQIAVKAQIKLIVHEENLSVSKSILFWLLCGFEEPVFGKLSS